MGCFVGIFGVVVIGTASDPVTTGPLASLVGTLETLSVADPVGAFVGTFTPPDVTTGSAVMWYYYKQLWICHVNCENRSKECILKVAKILSPFLEYLQNIDVFFCNNNTKNKHNEFANIKQDDERTCLCKKLAKLLLILLNASAAFANLPLLV